MSQAPSPSTGQPYGLARVCRVWGIARSTVSWQRRELARPAARRGPMGPCEDDALVDHIRRILEASSFPGEGYRKVWARLRHAGIRTSPRRVLRLMRAHQLLAPTRQGHPYGPQAHDGTIIPAQVDTMWGTDMTATFTRQEGQVALCIAIDHCSGECVGIHAAKQGTRFEALEPIRLLWGAETGAPRRGGILRVRGWDPVHFDPHLTIALFTHHMLSFVYSRLVRHKVGADVQPGTFPVEPDVAERWEEVDDTTYVFHLRKGVRWHNRPPVNGGELVAEDVKFTYDRFLTEKGNANRYMLEPVDRVEVVDRYTVRFRLKEPFVWLVNTLAYPWSTWIIAPEVVQHFGDLKQPETAIGTGPFLLERYEPNVKAVFTRHPGYFRRDQPYVDGVEWLIVQDDSIGLAMYRTGQLDCGPAPWWSVRQQDLEALKQSHPHLRDQNILSIVTQAIIMRTDQPPFHDVRVRRAISHAIDRQGLIEAVWGRGEPTAAVGRGLVDWSLPIDQLGIGAMYYQYSPEEARRLLADAGYSQGFKTQIIVSGGFGRDLVDDAQLVQHYLKDVGIEAELKIQEYGAYMATTGAGKV